MRSPTITINGANYSYAELRNISLESIESLSSKSAILFCKAWLNGQSEFKITTSGSTGMPKEILLKRSAMEASALQTIKTLNLKESDTALVCLDAKYIAGQMMIVRSLLLGMNMIIIEPSANPFEKLTDPVDFVALVPYQLETILNQSSEKLDLVKCAIIGGAAISYSLKEKIQKSQCSIYATYGMTETISHIALQKMNGNNISEYFEAFGNIELRTNERGCLCIKADYLDEEVVTNDLVELISSKKFKWLGRIDNVINSGGIKIIPERIENIIQQIFESHQVSKRFFVAGLSNEKLGEGLTLVIEGNRLINAVFENIQTDMKKRLSKYELPKEIKYVDHFVETATGKINRLATLAIHLQQT